MLRILDSKSPADADSVGSAPAIEAALNASSADRYSRVKAALRTLGVPFVENPRLVRGLDYYDHTAFEFKLKHVSQGQDTVMAGGYYGGLVSSLGGPSSVSGIGWAAGVERLLNLAHDIHGEDLEGLAWAEGDVARVAVIAMDAGADERVFDTLPLKVVQGLRHMGYTVPSLTKGTSRRQLKHANQVGAKAAILVHSDASVTVRNMETGDQVELRRGLSEDSIVDAVDVVLRAEGLQR